MALKLNVYEIEHEACPECDIEGELTYISNCRACHCGNCGSWVDLDGTILEDDQHLSRGKPMRLRYSRNPEKGLCQTARSKK